MSNAVANDRNGKVNEKGAEDDFSSNDSKVDFPADKVKPKREKWNSKMEFMLSVIGFAVDLGNVWRFPYICYKNGGGAFLIPYFVVAILGGVPMFYLELMLGQFHRKGCITIWKNICPMMKGIGYASCLVVGYVVLYYNTIIAWSMYYMFRSFTSELPWSSCNHTWADSNCVDKISSVANNMSYSNTSQSPAQQFFDRHVLHMHNSTGITDLGTLNWPITGCSLLVLVIIYFCAWKGIRSSGKVVWFTATFPYVVLFILMIRGVTLPGAARGIKYYLQPQWSALKNPTVWLEATVQIFFSLGPGFGILITLSSYNDFKNKCHRDAIITSCANCVTSFLSGFVVFAVLGYMAHILNKPDIEDVTTPGMGLLFVVYGEALSTIGGSVFFSIIFFLMIITLGLDTMFAAFECIVTGFADEFPATIGKHRKLFLLFLLTIAFVGSLPTTTYGGVYVITLLEMYASGTALTAVILMECVAVAWIYGTDRLSSDIKSMLGFTPSLLLRLSWKFSVPAFALFMIIMSIIFCDNLWYDGYEFPDWVTAVGWLISLNSILLIPAFAAHTYFTTPGTPRERFRAITTPNLSDEELKERQTIMTSLA